jgi:hypothetical protein
MQKNELIFWKLCSIQKKILDNVTCNLNSNLNQFNSDKLIELDSNFYIES